MRPQSPPPPTYAFGYRRPPRSGNEINGLGVRQRQRARHVFHNASDDRIDWQELDDFFSFINPWRVVRHVLGNVWQLRRQDGPVRGRPRAVDDPVAMTTEVKAEARRLGADLVGISRISDEALFEGVELPYELAICIGLPMDRGEMRWAPQQRAAAEVMRTYRRVARVAVRLGETIRQWGWPARAYGNPNSTDILQIPLAIDAGLGQLGKHGSMISKQHGSNFRLAAVLTNLPMVVDEPVDIGVDDLCLACQRCVEDCPADAIFNEKQLVRGQRKWYVDFDRCIPYFVKTHGCAICIEVCPFSEPGRGPLLVEQLLRYRRNRRRSS